MPKVSGMPIEHAERIRHEIGGTLGALHTVRLLFTDKRYHSDVQKLLDEVTLKLDSVVNSLKKIPQNENKDDKLSEKV